MRNKYLFILLSIIVFTCMANRASASSKNINLTEIRNPFESWLPKIEEIVEKTQETTKIIKEVAKPKVEESILPIETPKILKPKEPPSVRITGLIWNSDRPQAIINNHVVSEGDAVEDFTIVRIHPSGIDIDFLGEIFTIKIEKTQVNAI